MVKEPISILLEILTLENGKMIKKMVVAFISTNLGKNMMEIGKMIKKSGKDLLQIRREIFISANGKQTKWKVQGFLLSKVVISMKESF